MGKKPKILVVGSFVMDQIVTTRVFPRQGQTILAERFNKAPGGKGANQAVQMARLGAQVTMCGKLGHDANGDEMRRTCEEAGIDTSCIRLLRHHPRGAAERRHREPHPCRARCEHDHHAGGRRLPEGPHRRI